MKKALCLVVTVVAATVASGAASAGAAVQPATVSHDKPADAGRPTDAPGKAKGHDKGKAKGQAKGHSGAPSTGGGNGSGNNNGKANGNGNGSTRGAAPSGTGRGKGSGNENAKITFCHVPPGNPANGHLITTSVNAITPGHTNHTGDIIPPFSFVKHGATVTFPGQNWDAAGQAALANGCDAADLVAAEPTRGDSSAIARGETDLTGTLRAPGTPEASAVQTEVVADGSSTAISTTSASADTPGDGGLIDGILPSTGGARLAVLVAGVALLAGGVLLVTQARRRRQQV